MERIREREAENKENLEKVMVRKMNEYERKIQEEKKEVETE